jgi:hypothetical protein
VLIRAVLLVLVAGAGLVFAVGSWLQSAALASGGGVVALLALAGYVAVAGRAAPGQVRWPLLAATLLLAAGLGASIGWLSGPRYEYGWFSYAPRSATTDLVRMVDASLAILRWIALGLLLAGAGFGVAGLATARIAPAGRLGRWRAVAAIAIGALMLAVVVVRWRSIIDQGWSFTGRGTTGQWVDLAGAAWLAILAAGVAIAAAVLSGRLAGWQGWLGVVGGLLFAVPALALADAGAQTVPTKWLFAVPISGGFLAPGLRYGVDTSTRPTDLYAGLVSAALVAGAALLAIAVLRSAAQADDEVSVS